MESDVIAYFKRDRFAELLGIKILTANPGYAKGMLEVRPEHLNGFRVIQGGVIFTLADFICAVACNADGQHSVSVNASISYIKSGTGSVIYAEAKELVSNSRLSSYEVIITNDKEERIATFQGMCYRKRETLAEVIQRLPD